MLAGCTVTAEAAVAVTATGFGSITTLPVGPVACNARLDIMHTAIHPAAIATSNYIGPSSTALFTLIFHHSTPQDVNEMANDGMHIM